MVKLGVNVRRKSGKTLVGCANESIGLISNEMGEGAVTRRPCGQEKECQSSCPQTDLIGYGMVFKKIKNV